MPVHLIAAKKGIALVRAGKSALEEWRALPPERQQTVRDEAERVRSLLAELAGAGRARVGGRAAPREAAAITAELGTAVQALTFALGEVHRGGRVSRMAIGAVGRPREPEPVPPTPTPEEDSMPDPPSQPASPEVREAWDLYREVLALAGRTDAAEYYDTLMANAQKAVRLAPDEPDLLALLAYELYPYNGISRTARKLMVEWQEHCDELGGPSDFALDKMGPEAYAHNRLQILSKAMPKKRRFFS